MSNNLFEGIDQTYYLNKDMESKDDFCGKCFATGIVEVPNGKDDFDKEFCNCETGRIVMNQWSSEE